MEDDIDQGLIELQHQLGDVNTMLGICVSMRANTAKLLTALRTCLEDTKEIIERLVPLLPVVALGVLLAGCAIDVGKLAADMKRPSVTFESPESWSCDQSMKIPTGSSGVIEDCSVCRNRVNVAQRVTIKNAPLDVPANGKVLLCPTSAKVMAPTP